MRKALSLIYLRLRRTWMVMLSISILCTGIGWFWHANNILDSLDDETKAYDDGVKKFTNKPWFPWGAVKRSKDVVIVAIDDKTFRDVKVNPAWLQEYGSWPYDRRIYADAFEYIHSLGAKQIIFDATLDEPRSDPSGDYALGDAVKASGTPLYLGFNVTVWGEPLPAVTAVNHPPIHPADAGAAVPTADADAGAGEEEFPEEAVPTEADAAAQLAARRAHLADLYAFPVEMKGGLEVPALGSQPAPAEVDGGGLTTVERPLLPVPTIEPVLDAVSGYGVVVQEPDEDGKLRRTRFAYSDGTNTYAILPLAAAADALHAEKVTIEPGWLTLGTHRVRIDKDGAAWINYGGKLDDRFDTVSLVDVLRYRTRESARAQAEALFKDKYVFVGGFALGTGDVKATPLESAVPGVVKQVATFENLLHDDFVTDAPIWFSLVFTFVVAFCSAALVMIVRNTFFDLAWPVVLFVGFFLVTGSFLVLTDIHVLSAMPSLAGTIASVMATTWERVFANRERDRLKEMFKPYMEEDLVDLLVEQRELPKLDGEEMSITAYFSDIKGFSTFSEAFHKEPKGLMRVLNRYLSAVTPPIRAEGACIDKYIGDAVVALFGAPIPHDDHPLRACRAALAVQKVVGELREQFRKEGLPDVYTRIGLNTDRLLVGNIGSDQLLDYTAIGDGMNLASRLEGVNKVYGTNILIGENTWAAVKGDVFCREVDQVRVAGKHTPTRIYELIGLRGDETKEKVRLLGLYEVGLKLYRARSFAEAKTVFTEALGVDAADGPTLTMLARCDEHLQHPPPETWDGVTDLEK